MKVAPTEREVKNKAWCPGAHKTETMNKISTYLRESYRELIEKVTWPTWPQLQQATVIVLVATVLITLVVWIMDVASQTVLHFIYSLL